MFGFEIKVNDEEVRHVASDGVLTVFMFFGTPPPHFKVKYSDEMIVSGLSSNEFHLRWQGRELGLGDRIKITVADIKDVEHVTKKERRLDDLLEEYNALRQELEKEGLI